MSHHLRVLREAGIVTSERRGNWIFFRPVPDVAERLATIAQGLVSGRLLPVADVGAGRRPQTGFSAPA